MVLIKGDRNANSNIPSSLAFEGKRLIREPDIFQVFNYYFTSIEPKLGQRIDVRSGDDCLQIITTKFDNTVFRTVDENYILYVFT